LKLGLAGDTMLGRKVAEAISEQGPDAVLADEVVAVAHEADLLVLNLECCISERGERRRDPGKPFFFRAPPAATEVLTRLGVDCVTPANNHVLDYGTEALLDTLTHLRAAGIAYVGAGPDVAAARAPADVAGGTAFESPFSTRVAGPILLALRFDRAETLQWTRVGASSRRFVRSGTGSITGPEGGDS
jgi:poly-gamma-glutamate synthesis protein (capsule biosynthesis protein)